VRNLLYVTYEKALPRYEESLKIAEKIGDRSGKASSQSQIGSILQKQGEYDKALTRYEESLKIFNEISDRLGVASSQAQIGKILFEQGQYAQTFECFLVALSIFAELKSPSATIVIKDLIKLRAAWGEDNFDPAWKEKTGEEVLEVFKEENGNLGGK